MNDEIKKYLDSANFKFKDVDEDGNEIELTLSEEIENLIDNNKRLADYITNLQQEISKLTAESTEWESKCYDLQQENERQSKAQVILDDMLVNYKQENERLKEELVKIPRAKMEYDLELEDYKSRCEKAIEYMKVEMIDEPIRMYKISQIDVKKLLNILQGSEDNDI